MALGRILNCMCNTLCLIEEIVILSILWLLIL